MAYRSLWSLAFVAALAACGGGDDGAPGATGPDGPAGPAGPTGAPGPGSVGTAYTIPGVGGTFGGGYLALRTANGQVSLNLTCNYGAAGERSAFFFAETPAVTTGTVAVTIAIDGQPLLAFNDLNYNSGGQDYAVFDGTLPSPWPWAGVFTVNQGGTVTRWDVVMTGSSTGDCTAVVYNAGGDTATVVQP